MFISFLNSLNLFGKIKFLLFKIFLSKLRSFLTFFKVKFLIIDCFRFNEHVTHLDLYNTLKLIKLLKPKKSILTNLHIDLDYEYLKKVLPKNVIPAYDGLNFNF